MYFLRRAKGLNRAFRKKWKWFDAWETSQEQEGSERKQKEILRLGREGYAKKFNEQWNMAWFSRAFAVYGAVAGLLSLALPFGGTASTKLWAVAGSVCTALFVGLVFERPARTRYERMSSAPKRRRRARRIDTNAIDAVLDLYAKRRSSQKAVTPP